MAKNKRSIDPSIIAALIGVAGTIIVTLITVYANRPAPEPQATPFPTWTIPATSTITNTPAPTDTVPAGEPSSTPAPDTPTPDPTFTPAPPAIGEDWVNNCISALWQVIPASIQTNQENGCLEQPVGDFSINNDRLTFLVNRRFDSAEVNGMFAPLSAEGTVSLNVHLDILEKGEVWMGVFAEPSIDSMGVIMYIPAGDVKRRSLVMQSLPGNNKSQTQQFNQTSATYDVKFTYTIGSVAVSAMNESVVFNAVPIPSGKKWLFIGFRAANGNTSIGASFFDLAFAE